MGNICSFLIKKQEPKIHPEITSRDFFTSENVYNNDSNSIDDEPPSYYETINNVRVN